MKLFRTTLILFAAAAFFLVEAKTYKISSDPAGDIIRIDGDISDWTAEALQRLDDDMSAGVCNDSDYVYLLIIIEDQQLQRQVMTAGMTVWFEQEGKKKKKIGIKYPAGGSFRERKENFEPPAFDEDHRQPDPMEGLNSVGDEFKLLVKNEERSNLWSLSTYQFGKSISMEIFS